MYTIVQCSHSQLSVQVHNEIELDAPGSKVIATQSSPLLAANPNIVCHDQHRDQDDDCLQFGHISNATPRLKMCARYGRRFQSNTANLECEKLFLRDNCIFSFDGYNSMKNTNLPYILKMCELYYSNTSVILKETMKSMLKNSRD